MKHRKRLDLNTPEGRESFIKTVEELKQRTVIVEGKKDVRALESLGLKKIIPLNNKPLIELVQEIINRGIKEVIILTDFDKEGRRLAAKLRTLFEAHKIRINSRLRCKMMEFRKTRLEDFATLGGELKLRGDDYGKVSTNFDKIHNKSKDKGKRRYRKTRCNRSNFWSDRRPAGL